MLSCKLNEGTPDIAMVLCFSQQKSAPSGINDGHVAIMKQFYPNAQTTGAI